MLILHSLWFLKRRALLTTFFYIRKSISREVSCKIPTGTHLWIFKSLWRKVNYVSILQKLGFGVIGMFYYVPLPLRCWGSPPTCRNLQTCYILDSVSPHGEERLLSVICT